MLAWRVCERMHACVRECVCLTRVPAIKRTLRLWRACRAHAFASAHYVRAGAHVCERVCMRKHADEACVRWEIIVAGPCVSQDPGHLCFGSRR